MPALTPDVVLIGGGVMSAHVGVMLKCLDPRLSIEVFEASDVLAGESSEGWNNAGTGHAGLCELNYTPPPTQAGAVDVSRAIEIFAKFEQSRQFWGYAVGQGIVSRPAGFIRSVPHVSFVRGEAEVAFLRARHAAMSGHPFFRAMRFTTDRAALGAWAPLVVEGRESGAIGATRAVAGTDISFGELARQLLHWLGTQEGCRVWTGHRTTGLRRSPAGWTLTVREAGAGESRRVDARFVFIGAGGGTLPLLQSSGLPVARGLGAFPIAGQWLVCDNPSIVARHFAKVYGSPPADSGALGGPHLDVRHIQGRRVLLFGPFATWTTRFLHRTGGAVDLARAIRPDNIPTYLHTGLRNRVLVRFLVKQALQSRESRLEALRLFYPKARDADWRLLDAGIRVQALKRADAGRLHFGTEVVTAADGTLAALLGASPGASVSASIALQIIQACFPERLQSSGGWARMKAMVPTFDLDLGSPAEATHYAAYSAKVDELLGLQPVAELA